MIGKLAISGLLGLTSLTQCKPPQQPTTPNTPSECVLNADGSTQGTCALFQDPKYDVIYNPFTKTWEIDTICQEDQECWNCATMGNQTCGPK